MKLEDVEIRTIKVWESVNPGVIVTYQVRGSYITAEFFRDITDEVGAIAALYKYLEVSDE